MARWLVLSTVLLTGCFSDLPQPLECPPPRRDQTEEPCFDQALPEPNACLPFEAMHCLTGDRTSCECSADECPTSKGCYPPGDCPAAVIEAVGPDARCHRLESSQIVFDYPTVGNCACGCMDCITLCDGYGPVIGSVTEDLEHARVVPLIDISAIAPSSGRLGLYVRLRGVANIAAIILKGTVDPPTLQPLGGFLVATPLAYDFQEQVLTNDNTFGLVVPPWTDAADKPTAIMLTGNFTDDVAISLFELDCVIPFFLPL